MWNQIFGTGANQAAQTMFGQSTTPTQGGLANQNTYYNALQQSALYNQMQQMANKPRFVFGNFECHTVEEFAEYLFPEDKEQQMMFILKFGGM